MTVLLLPLSETKPSSSAAMEMEVDKESGAETRDEQPMFEKTGDQVTEPPPPDLLRTDSPESHCRSPYNPRSALVMAILDWLPELYKMKTSAGGTVRPPDKAQFSDGDQSDVKVNYELFLFL